MICGGAAVGESGGVLVRGPSSGWVSAGDSACCCDAADVFAAASHGGGDVGLVGAEAEGRGDGVGFFLGEAFPACGDGAEAPHGACEVAAGHGGK